MPGESEITVQSRGRVALAVRLLGCRAGRNARPMVLVAPLYGATKIALVSWATGKSAGSKPS